LIFIREFLPPGSKVNDQDPIASAHSLSPLVGVAGRLDDIERRLAELERPAAGN
jgi:hypothetical protein